MRILLLMHGFNALSQRIFVELKERGHDVSIEFDINDETTIEAVTLFSPDVIFAPFLKRAIADEVWQNHLCLIVHPGPMGDRGPSALDWAIMKSEKIWGVTVLQAEAEMDAGPIWSHSEFKLRPATKSSIYRNEVMEAAVISVLDTVKKLENGDFQPRILNYDDDDIAGCWQDAIKQKDRKIDWHNDSTQIVLNKIWAADGAPGVYDTVLGRKVYLFDGQEAAEMNQGISGKPGDILAVSGPAICRATRDGAVWIGHVRDRKFTHDFKLPASLVFARQVSELPIVPIDSQEGYQEIFYQQDGDIGYLSFNFYNGAMSSEQCTRLLAAYNTALEQDTKVIVLKGGEDFWSNGMHLNIIEAADSPADESWRNINAIDDLAEAILRTDTHITIAALKGNAGAGGVFLARACDKVVLRDGVILNPHYKDMGNLYGSEFWTYLLPKYTGEADTNRIVKNRLPMGAGEAVRLGLADEKLSGLRSGFDEAVKHYAQKFANEEVFQAFMQTKIVRRNADEKAQSLSAYRTLELDNMKRNFFGFDPSYHVARYNFVHKIVKSRTPPTLARHRDQLIQNANKQNNSKQNSGNTKTERKAS